MDPRLLRPAALGRIRLAEEGDVLSIMSMVNDSIGHTFRIYRHGDVAGLLESAVLCIVQLDSEGVIIGFLALRDYPLIPAVHPSAWEEYIWTKYRAIELNARNTLFVHLICWNPIYARELVDNMLKSVFMHDPYLNYIVMVKTLINYPLLVKGQMRSEGSFKRVQAMEKGVSGDLLPLISIADRKEVCPRLRIRRAVEEDNDDIVPIIERQSTRLQEMYGEFYISELISRHPESERVLLVCEDKEVAVGIMCLNTQINFEELEESYDLSPFAGLRKLNENKGKISRQMSVGLDSASNVMERLSMAIPYDEFEKEKDLKSKVTWELGDEEIDISSAESSIKSIAVSEYPFSIMDVVSLFGDDDDELDFDIVNIETELLKIPEKLSYETLMTGVTTQSISKLLDNEKVMEEDGDKNIYKNAHKNVKRSRPGMNGSSNHQRIEPARYSGRSNAFLIELFALHEEYDERYGFDILEAAYDMFPDRDYCIICLPSKHPSFPLLEHFTFVTPYGTTQKCVNESLYVAHVNSVRGNVRLRLTENRDLIDLEDILEHTTRRQTLIDIIEGSIASTTFDSYTMLSQNQPIGVVMLGPFEDNATVRSQFQLYPEPKRAGTDGSVLIGVMSPALEPHARWYIRELLRHSRYSTLFWTCSLFSKGDASPRRNMMSLAQHMIPVRPRSNIPALCSSISSEKGIKETSIPALWVIERPMTSLPKALINNSIVVVGASCTGLAFLETLIMGPSSRYLTFTNVTLVSKHGLPTVLECLKAADVCIPRVSRYTFRRLKSIPVYFYVDVVAGLMVNIDRKKKCIHLKGGEVKFYDELVLTCGKQFQHPEYMVESLETAREVEKGNPCERMLMDNPDYEPDRVPLAPDMPDNLLIINSLYEANLCMRRLLRMMSDAKDTSFRLCADNPVIVYGDCIEAYSCMAALIQLGLSPEMITFVEPFPSSDEKAMRVNCFNNEIIDEKVQDSISSLNIKVIRKCELSGWSLQGNVLMEIRVMAPLRCITMPCFALFYYGTKAINLSAFQAINECGLVYDGGLTIGPAFDTNDPDIYAAGTCCKYSRRLYAANKEHMYYASEDVGDELAKYFLRKMDPFLMGNPDCGPDDLLPRVGSFVSSRSSFLRTSTIDNDSLKSINFATKGNYKWQPVMRFESPIVISATLPGPLYYMTLNKPGPQLPLAVELALPEQGHILMTHKNNNYFRIKLDTLHCVQSMVCLATKHFPSDLITRAYGKHEAYLNKLLSRYQLNEIHDFFNYFTQPWMGAMYQEVFDELIYDINEKRIGTVYDLIKTKQSTMTMDTKSTDMDGSGSDSEFSMYSGVPSCGFGPEEARSLGTFRSILGHFLSKKSSAKIHKASHSCTLLDVQECGQNAGLRADARAFWNVIGGEDLVVNGIARHLARYSLVNPQYAPCE